MSRPGPEQLLRGRVDTFVTAATLPDRLDSFVALVRWTRPAAGDKGTLDELLNLLDDPRERRTFHAAISEMIAETDGTNVFADAGIPTERGLPAELGERVMNHVLPRPRNDRDLGHLMRRLFRRRADAERLLKLRRRVAAGSNVFEITYGPRSPPVVACR